MGRRRKVERDQSHLKNFWCKLVFSPLIFAIVVDVIIEYAKNGLKNELLNAGG